MNAAHNRLWAVLLVLLLAGCATVKTFPAQTLDQKIYLMIAGVDDAIETAVQARRAGAMDDATYERLDPLIKGAHTAAHAAAAFAGTGNEAGAEAQLQIADDLLWQIRAALPEAQP